MFCTQFKCTLSGIWRGSSCMCLQHVYYTSSIKSTIGSFLRNSSTCSAQNDFSLNSADFRKYVDNLVKEYTSLSNMNDENLNHNTNMYARLSELKPIVDIYNDIRTLRKSLVTLDEFNVGDSTDRELVSLVEEERKMYIQQIEKFDFELFQLLIPTDPQDSCSDIVLEVSAGVGGQEAMLFTRELCDMYIAYTTFKGWHVELAEMEHSQIGGLRHASILVSGDEVYKHLKHEAGVHRVQRIPATERSGRIHTSTVAVATLPQPTEVDVQLKDKDLHIETKRASGAGGQHVNTTDSAVRVTHIPTGITVECQTDRSQIKNKVYALQRLRAKIYQQQLDEQLAETNATRKLQVKSNMRSEKIRTYNFNQDRITDHRLSSSLHNLHGFLAGEELLDQLIQQLQVNSDRRKVLGVIKC